jgi:Xaa-Pro dipeptidase
MITMNELVLKIKEAIHDSKFDAILTVGIDNNQYLAGLFLPLLYSYEEKKIAILWPKLGEPILFAPRFMENTIKDNTRVEKIITYSDAPGEMVTRISNTIKENPSIRKLGIDLYRCPASLYTEINKIIDCEKFSCDDLLLKLRAIKTKYEVDLLENIAFKVDHGIFGTAHHVLVRAAKSEMGLSEDIRIHCMERYLEVTGGHSLSQGASGEHAKKFWPMAPFYGVGKEKQLQTSEYVRLEARYSIDGYWSDGTRLLTMGNPTLEQKKTYSILDSLRMKALHCMKPGAKCSEIYEALMKEAHVHNVKLYNGIALGHSIGCLTREPPYITASDNTLLKSGMVFVIDPVIEGPMGELLWLKDTIVITSEGSKMVGWYKDWRVAYIAALIY